jgi:hypothetical protein
MRRDTGNSTLKPVFLTILNNLQKNPFQVDSDLVNLLKNEPEKLLKLMDASLPKDKGYSSSILRVENGKLSFISYKESVMFAGNQRNLYKETFMLT